MTSCIIKQGKKVCIGRKMRFREITIEDKNWIGKLRDTNRYSLTAYAFPALYMWRREMGLTIAGDEKFFMNGAPLPILHREMDIVSMTR